ARVLSRFAVAVRFSELLPARCVSYLFSLVNYNAGQAGLALFLKRSKGVSFFKTLGSIFFVTAVDLYWVIGLAFLGSFFLPMSVKGFELQEWVRRVGYIAFLALILHLAFWRGWFGKVLPKRWHFSFGDWLRGRHLFQPFHHAKLLDYLKVALLRFPLHLIIVSSIWFLVRIAGASIPFRAIVGAVPLVLLLGAIPITPGGLGAVQVATVELLKDYVVIPPQYQATVHPTQLLLALSLAWMVLNYLLKALAGVFCLRLSSAHLMKDFADSEEIADPQAP